MSHLSIDCAYHILRTLFEECYRSKIMRVKKVDLNYLSSENKGADDLRLCLYICKKQIFACRDN